MKVVLALDIGTSSSRAAIFDARGRLVPGTLAQVPYRLQTGTDGRAELSSGTVARAVESVMRQTFRAWRKKKSSATISAVGVSCLWQSMLGLDAKGRALTPIYTWADSRSHRQAKVLRGKLGEGTLHARTGCMVRSSFWPAKLLWLRETQPVLFRRVARWVTPADWIQQRLCGEATISLSMASGTGLLDGHTLCWHAPLLRHCGVNARRLNPISDRPGTISPAQGRRFPELVGVPWYPAIGDGAASNLGSGATVAGMAAINVGTSAALRVVTRARPVPGKPLAPPGLFSYRVDRQRSLVGGAVSNAGNLHAWATSTLRLPQDVSVLEKRERSRSGPIGHLTVLPFWLGERAPSWPENIPSAVLGVTQATTALDLLLALQDATYLRLAQIAERVEKAMKRKLNYVVSGGIRHSPSALQRLANVLGRPVYLSQESEASLRGAACFALEKMGVKPGLPKFAAVIRPERKVAREYVKARKRQEQLETLLTGASAARRVPRG